MPTGSLGVGRHQAWTWAIESFSPRCQSLAHTAARAWNVSEAFSVFTKGRFGPERRFCPEGRFGPERREPRCASPLDALPGECPLGPLDKRGRPPGPESPSADGRRGVPGAGQGQQGPGGRTSTFRKTNHQGRKGVLTFSGKEGCSLNPGVSLPRPRPGATQAALGIFPLESSLDALGCSQELQDMKTEDSPPTPSSHCVHQPGQSRGTPKAQEKGHNRHLWFYVCLFVFYGFYYENKTDAPGEGSMITRNIRALSTIFILLC